MNEPIEGELICINDFRIILGRHLKEARTFKQLCLDVKSQPTISKIENGKQDLSMVNFIILCETLNVCPVSIFFNSYNEFKTL